MGMDRAAAAQTRQAWPLAGDGSARGVERDLRSGAHGLRLAHAAGAFWCLADRLLVVQALRHLRRNDLCRPRQRAGFTPAGPVAAEIVIRLGTSTLTSRCWGWKKT